MHGEERTSGVAEEATLVWRIRSHDQRKVSYMVVFATIPESFVLKETLDQRQCQSIAHADLISHGGLDSNIARICTVRG